jgi:hypothetical protein
VHADAAAGVVFLHPAQDGARTGVRSTNGSVPYRLGPGMVSAQSRGDRAAGHFWCLRLAAAHPRNRRRVHYAPR